VEDSPKIRCGHCKATTGWVHSWVPVALSKHVFLFQSSCNGLSDHQWITAGSEFGEDSSGAMSSYCSLLALASKPAARQSNDEPVKKPVKIMGASPHIYRRSLVNINPGRQSGKPRPKKKGHLTFTGGLLIMPKEPLIRVQFKTLP